MKKAKEKVMKVEKVMAPKKEAMKMKMGCK